MNRIALMLALTAGITCVASGYEPPRHNDTFTTNGVTYAQRGGLGAADYVVTNIDASAIGKVTSVNGMDGDVVIDAKSVGAVANDANYLAVSNRAMTALQSYTETDPRFHEWVGGVTNDMGVIRAAESAMFAYLLGGPASEVSYAAEDITAISNGFAAADETLSSRLSLASLAATNYTDEVIGAAIANTNPAFSNAVLSVGLGIDTNTVAVINALVEAGDELPIGGAATVGGLLLALAAAVAALKRTKADASALRYDLASETVINTASQETVEGKTVNYGGATLADRTGNRVSITATLDELRVTFPPAVSGKLRDFGLRVEVGTGSAALTAPAIVPVAPTGETIKLENNAKQIPALADGEAAAKGVTLLYFSESAPGVFFAKGEQVGEVA